MKINRKHLLLLLAVTVILRFLSSWLVKDFKPTLWEYEVLTQNMLERGEYVFDYRDYGEYKALLAPGFSCLTYSVYSVFGTNHVIMLFIQYLLIFAGCVAIYKISMEFFDNENYALTAALLCSIHPGLIHYSSNMLHQLTLYLPLFYWTLFCLIKCYKTGEWKFYIWAGVLGGLAVLSRATMLPIVVVNLVLICILKKDFKQAVGKAAVAYLLLLLVNMPWVIRNYMVFDKFIFAQTNKWESFWIGNNEIATGGHYNKEGEAVLNNKPPALQAELDASDSELLDNEIFKKHALKYVENNQGEFVGRLFKKAFYFWWFSPHTGVLYPPKVVAVAKVLYSVFLVVFFSSLVICFREKLFRKENLLALMFVLGIYGVHVLYFFETRHRWTVEPILIIFASIAVVRVLEKITGKFKKAESGP